MFLIRAFSNIILIKFNRWIGKTELDFREKITLFACLLGSGLNCIFHWYAQWLTFSESQLSSFADLFISCTFQKREVSSTKILHNEVIPSGRSLM